MDEQPAAQADVEIDVGAVLSSLIGKLPYIIVFVGIVAVTTFVALDRIAPVHKADATVIIESGESRPVRTTQPVQPSPVPMTAAVSAAAAVLALALVVLSELASGRPLRRVAPVAAPSIVAGAANVANLPQSPAIDAEEAPSEVWADPPQITQGEPTLAPVLAGRVEQSLHAIAADLTARGAKRVLVMLAEGSESAGRPLAALALARALAEGDGRVVLVDFSGDRANAASVGQRPGISGLADVFDGAASFSEVLFRDCRSRVHYLPAGTRLLVPSELGEDRLETLLSALTMTYDQVVLDVRSAALGRLAPSASAALVVSEFPARDPRTARAMAAIEAAAPAAEVHLLVVDRASAGDGLERAARVAAEA
jgi:succinoglycan biosynthesis transport protein ExoP